VIGQTDGARGVREGRSGACPWGAEARGGINSLTYKKSPYFFFLALIHRFNRLW
jgi:hypothetical protein